MQSRFLFAASLAAFAAAAPSRAAVPQTIPFQGILQTPAGSPKPDGPYGVVFRLYTAATGGAAIYTEPATSGTSKTVTVAGGHGLFNTSLGDVTPFPATLAFDKPYFLSIQVVGDAEMTPRSPLQSVPYALSSGSLALPLSQSASSDGTLLSITNTGTGYALYGNASATTGYSGGIYGTSAAPGGLGVYGEDTSASGQNYGVAGQSYSSSGVGVYGAALADTSSVSGFPIGVWGQDQSNDGAGIYGVALSSSGAATGIHGVTHGNGIGVWGEHTASSGTAAGVEGDTASTASSAAGVLGQVTSTAPGGFSAGVRGVNNGTTGLGIGVYGSQAGSGYGVYGSTPSGFGVVGSSNSGTGVDGESTSGKGVYGSSSSSSGVYGSSNTYVGVYGTSTSNIGILGSSDNSGGVRGDSLSGYGLVGATKTGNIFVGGTITASGGGISFKARIDNNGKVFANGGYQTGGADVAEFVPSTGDPQPGDVVEIDPDHDTKFRLAATPNSTAVAGVISTLPGVSMGAYKPAEAETTGPQLALVGRVPVKATCENGPIHRGDLLVASSSPGRAMRAPAAPAPGTVIGKALGTLNSGNGTVEMLVMLR